YVVVQRTPFATIGANHNLASLGKLLDQSLSVSSGGISDLIDKLDTTALNAAGVSLGTSNGILSTARSYAAINATLQGLNPAGYAELANLGFDRLLEIQLGLVNHLRTLAGPQIEDAKAGELAAWTSAYGGWTRRDGEASYGSAGYSSSNFGNITGVEKRIGALTIGLAGALGSSSATLGSGMGSVSTDSWHAGVYGSTPMELAGYEIFADAALAFGNGDTTFKRDVSVPGISGGASTSVKGENSEWFMQLGGAFPLRTGDNSLTVTPSMHLLLAGFTQRALSEPSMNGFGALVGNQTETSASVRTGVQFAKMMKLASRETRFSASLDWVHAFDSSRRGVDISLNGTSGGGARFESSKAGTEAARLGLGGEMVLTRWTRLRINLDEQVQANQSSSIGSISIGVQF
ncbi:MAG: autotransporter outer membrane beta-barrel domain-containing protein, partial [Verrucomicrobiota bacterium]